MTFTTFAYLLFVPIVFGIYWSLKSRSAQNVLLVLVSYFFYGWWDFRFCLLMLTSSLVDYWITLRIDQTEDGPRRKRLLVVSLLVNFGLLGFFKYFNFFSDSLVATLRAANVEVDSFTLRIILPAGISFYTFQTMSYAIDVYRRKMSASRGLVDYLAFVSFFPHLVAGPIMRAYDFLPQFHQRRTFDPEIAADGCRQMLWGFVKKVTLADNFSRAVDLAYSAPASYTGPQLAFATVCFALQIYCDFSAYADIAMGTAKLFGFRLTRNFAYPYFSQSPAEFWRRWHISLATWFRDYVYLPLGGNRVGRARHAVNLMLTFVLSGLWHGASWNFVVWGAINGAALLPGVFFLRRSGAGRVEDVPGGPDNIPRPSTVLRMLATFSFVCLTWVFFRSQSLGDSFLILEKIAKESFRLENYANLALDSRATALIPFFLVVEWIQRRHLHALSSLAGPRWGRWAIYTCLLWGGLCVSPGSANPFIYFQF